MNKQYVKGVQKRRKISLLETDGWQNARSHIDFTIQ